VRFLSDDDFCFGNLIAKTNKSFRRAFFGEKDNKFHQGEEGNEEENIAE